MNLIIITGMSGAGKTSALKFLEDAGFFCVDNFPVFLISKLSEFHPDASIKQTALSIDVRGGRSFKYLLTNLKKLHRNSYKILFLDASDDILLKRFKETRRLHPLSKKERIIVGIEEERAIMSDVKKISDYIIDTSHVKTNELRKTLLDLLVNKKEFSNLTINVISFGFKYGIPTDSDLLFDVRFIPNPFYIPTLKEQTGENSNVKDFVLKHKASIVFLNKVYDLISFLIPHYINEGKNQLVISIGCTGGQHRSVVIAIEILKKLLKLNYNAFIIHRDIKNSIHITSDSTKKIT
jgi:UPF0042 nucleotide-binding protein